MARDVFVTVKLTGWDRALNMLKVADTGLFTGTKPMRRKLLNNAARAGRDLSRQNIRTQGNGTWPPLSDWTKAKTGRRKALLAQIPRIHAVFADATARASAVTFRSPAKWTLSQHHKGFTEPATNKLVKIELKRTVKNLKLKKGTAVFFHDNKPTVVPRRPIWPEGVQLQTMVSRVLKKWKLEFDRKLQRVR